MAHFIILHVASEDNGIVAGKWLGSVQADSYEEALDKFAMALGYRNIEEFKTSNPAIKPRALAHH